MALRSGRVTLLPISVQISFRQLFHRRKPYSRLRVCHKTVSRILRRRINCRWTSLPRPRALSLSENSIKTRHNLIWHLGISKNVLFGKRSALRERKALMSLKVKMVWPSILKETKAVKKRARPRTRRFLATRKHIRQWLARVTPQN